MENRDTFGLAPDAYRKFRPRYPPALFEFLASLCIASRAALDCATGNGQAAVGLAEFFDRVAAFDSSEDQIAHAIAHARVEYRVGTAEALPFRDTRFDLVTAAQSAHWFDLPVFYANLDRVAHAETVVAIFGYGNCAVDEAIDAVVATRLLAPIEAHWAEGNRVIMDKYRKIPFPFREIAWPGFVARHEWSRETYLSFVRTWSAVKKHELVHGYDVVADVERGLLVLWPDETPKTVSFELVGRVGRI